MSLQAICPFLSWALLYSNVNWLTQTLFSWVVTTADEAISNAEQNNNVETIDNPEQNREWKKK